MISNREFMQRQAYEISWAVFRCAELFSQSALKEKIESAAVDLTASCGSAIDASGTNVSHIEKLVALIRLAESVGQIAPVNANVLYRELDNLSKATRVSVAEQRGKENITESLERIFTSSAYTKSLTTSTPPVNPAVNSVSVSSVIPAEAGIRHSPKQAVAVNPVIRQNNANQFGSIESLISAAVLPNKPIPAPVIPAKAGIHNSANVPASVGSWQYVILQKVKDLGQTTTKELTASFPEISERTIRFYLQKLVDSGVIDRIGSTGPGAAYKAK